MVYLYCIYSVLCLFFSISAAHEYTINRISNKFKLITSLYNETDEKRMQEYLFCLATNMAHPLIDEIHVLYDTSKDDATCTILHWLQQHNISITTISGRPTFRYCVDFANAHYSGEKVIISNADIYFNDTLQLLMNYSFENTFLALTRWNILKDGTLTPYIWPNGKPAIYSQDTWIFQTPLPVFEDASIVLGVPHCDGRIAFQAHKAGLKVTNPCKTIQCCHVHLSGIRNYDALPFPVGKAMPVPWCELE